MPKRSMTRSGSPVRGTLTSTNWPWLTASQRGKVTLLSAESTWFGQTVSLTSCRGSQDRLMWSPDMSVQAIRPEYARSPQAKGNGSDCSAPDVINSAVARMYRASGVHGITGACR